MSREHNAALFEQQYPELFAYAYRYVMARVPHVQDAEDMVSAVFISAYATIDTYSPEKGNLRQWITGMLRHRIIDYWRSRRNTINLDELADMPDIRPQRDIHTRIDEEAFFKEVMESLSPKMRSIFTLRYVDDYTYEEIASIVHKTPAAVRKAFSDLHKKLRTHCSENFLGTL